MTTILLPIAGRAQRFVDKGYKIPKPLIHVNGTPMLKRAVDCLLTNNASGQATDDVKLVFIVLKEHEINFDITNSIRRLFPGMKVEFVQLDGVTQGTLCSCLLAKEHINNDEPLIIYTPDVCFETPKNLVKDFKASKADGHIVTFKANSADHSYATTDGSYVTATAEKQVISNDALVGVYCFRTGKSFVKYGEEMIENKITVKNEYYLAPTYNLLIRDGLKITWARVEKMYVLGTPEDLDFYEDTVARYDTVTDIALCCDHSGHDLKESIMTAAAKLRSQFGPINVHDFGSYTPCSNDQYDSLWPCLTYLTKTPRTLGIGVCATGQGYNIAANKFAGIRSALVWDEHTAEMSRRHNAANFFSIPAKYVKEEAVTGILRAILSSSFDGGRHATRIQKFSTAVGFIK